MDLLRRKNWLLILCSLLAFSAAAAPSAPEQFAPGVKRYTLQLDDHAFKPRDIVKLKLLLANQHPDAHIRNMRLSKVEILAKSRLGKGKIALRVGNAISEPYTVPGAEEAFDSKEAGTFHNTTIINKATDQTGRWQLFIGGYFKIRYIVLELVPGGSEI